jgi:hypothetical protein
MLGVFPAPITELQEFQALLGSFLVLGCRVIFSFTLGTSQSYNFPHNPPSSRTILHATRCGISQKHEKLPLPNFYKLFGKTSVNFFSLIFGRFTLQAGKSTNIHFIMIPGFLSSPDFIIIIYKVFRDPDQRVGRVFGKFNARDA